MSIVTFRDLAYVIDQDSNIIAIKALRCYSKC